MLSEEALKDMWKNDVVERPSSIDYGQLRYEQQLSSNIILVTVPTTTSIQKMVFKSQTISFSGLYHELQVVLTLPRSDFIAEPPGLLVKIKGRDQQESRSAAFLWSTMN